MTRITTKKTGTINAYINYILVVLINEEIWIWDQLRA